MTQGGSLVVYKDPIEVLKIYQVRKVLSQLVTALNPLAKMTIMLRCKPVTPFKL